MATDKKLVKIVRYTHLHRFIAAIALLTFLVIIIAGIAARVSFVTITLRSAVALIAVGLLSRVVTRIIASYEEMKGGQA